MRVTVLLTSGTSTCVLASVLVPVHVAYTRKLSLTAGALRTIHVMYMYMTLYRTQLPFNTGTCTVTYNLMSWHCIRMILVAGGEGWTGLGGVAPSTTAVASFMIKGASLFLLTDVVIVIPAIGPKSWDQSFGLELRGHHIIIVSWKRAANLHIRLPSSFAFFGYFKGWSKWPPIKVRVTVTVTVRVRF